MVPGSSFLIRYPLLSLSLIFVHNSIEVPVASVVTALDMEYIFIYIYISARILNSDMTTDVPENVGVKKNVRRSCTLQACNKNCKVQLRLTFQEHFLHAYMYIYIYIWVIQSGWVFSAFSRFECLEAIYSNLNVFLEKIKVCFI